MGTPVELALLLHQDNSLAQAAYMRRSIKTIAVYAWNCSVNLTLKELMYGKK
jgi:hypothetical protein